MFPAMARNQVSIVAVPTSHRVTGSGVKKPRPIRPRKATASGAVTRATRKRLSAAERKAQIVEVAIALFGGSGFHGTTTKAIARAAGISEATMFSHFATKEDIYVSAFQHRAGSGVGDLVAELEQFADRNDDDQLVSTVIAAILYGYCRDRDLHRLLGFAWLEQAPAANTRMWKQLEHYPLFEFLERYITQRQASGVFRPGNPHAIAFALVGLAAHYGQMNKLYGIDFHYEDKVVIETYTTFFLNGTRIGNGPARSR